MSYRAEQVESPIKPDVQPIGVQGASSDTGTQSFNNTYRQALASRNPSNAGLPDVTFVDGSNSVDYPAQQTGPKSFALGVDKIDIRNTNPEDLVQKFDGIADGLGKTIVTQIQEMAADPNYVNKGLLQMGEAVQVAGNYYADKISTGDWNGFTNDVGQAGIAIKHASDDYSKAPPKQQGEVIGTTMAMFLPVPALARETEGASEAGLVNKAIRDGGDLIDVPGDGNIGKDPSAERLEATLDQLEAHEKKFIADKNISFAMVDSINDVRPGTPESVLGLCRMHEGGNPEIFLSKSIEPKEFPFVLRHEFGHAVDRTYLGNGDRIAYHPKFVQAYQSDLAALSQEDAKILDRYCEPNGVGALEAFASLYAHSMGAQTEVERELLLREKFPSTFKLMSDFADHFSKG